MESLTRGEVAREIGAAVPSLIYWERKGELKPKKVTVGSKTLVAYSPRLIEKAKKILRRRGPRKKQRKE